MNRRTLRQARALARLKIDALVGEAWSAHVREQAAEDRREQQTRQEEANRQELLAILAQMRRRGWTTR